MRKHSGRGKPNFKCLNYAAKRDIAAVDSCMIASPLSKQSRLTMKNIRRVQQWIARLKVLARTPLTFRNTCTSLLLTMDTIRDIQHDLGSRADLHDANRALLDLVADAEPNDHRPGAILRLSKVLKGLQKLHKEQCKDDLDARRSKFANELAKDKYCKKSHKILKGKGTPPLLYTKRTTVGPGGEAVGTITTCPDEVDQTVRRAYQDIYAGNIDGDLNSHAARFVTKYSQHIYRSVSVEVACITGEDLFAECTKGPYTAAGLDGWAPEDLSMLPLCAFNWLAQLLNRIEAGASWPSDLLHGKASFLSKTEEPSSDPLKYRILLLLPVLYRKWATVRLKHLKPWVQQWAMPEMFAGVPGAGAEDAWWLTSCALESAHLTGNKVTGGALDLHKCFDQINRQLAILLLLAAGMPPKIVQAYASYHSTLVVYNALAGGFGKAYHKVLSIPQGCPFSMMIIALMMRPWLCLVTLSNIIQPRVLADDLMLLGIGEGHLNAFYHAFSDTHLYMQDLGAKIAPEKSLLFSNDGAIRRWISEVHWIHLGTSIPVVVHLRDLGSHLNLSTRNIGSTLTRRMLKCITRIQKLRFLPLDQDTKMRLITTNIFAAGLYGSEATFASEDSLSRLTTACLDALGHTSSNRSPGICFNMSNREVDPWAHVFMRRISMLRRMLCKHVGIDVSVRDMIDQYARNLFPGTIQDSIDIPHVKPAPRPGHPDRAVWKQGVVPLGPIGHLLYSAAQYGVVIDKDLNCHLHRETSFSVLHTPFQFLNPIVRRFVCISRYRDVCERRSDLQGSPDVDFELLRRTLCKRQGMPEHEDDGNILHWIISKSCWSDAKLHDIGRLDDIKPCGCGHPKPDVLHMLWDCPLHDEARFSDPRMRDILQLHLPDSVKFGLPVVASADPYGPLFHNPLNTTVPARDYPVTIQDYANALGSSWRPNDDFYTGWNFYCQYVAGYPECAGHNARQLFDHLRGPFEPISLEDPPKVYNLPSDVEPETCNCFTDGSFVNPSSMAWSLGGGAIFHPERAIERRPLSRNEYSYCFSEDRNDGLGLFMPIPGQFGSSTRTEIVPGILALSYGLPIKLGADSANFIKMANRIIKDPYYTPPKPWGLMPNGDLWCVYQDQMQRRGGGVWPIQKLKAHTAIEDVAKGVISAAHRMGNETADVLARQGVGSHAVGLMQLSYAYVCTERIYCELLNAIYDMFVRVFKAAEALRKQEAERGWATGASRPSNAQVVAPKLPEISSAERQGITVLHPAIPHRNLVASGGVAFVNVWNFLRNLSLAPVIFPAQGTSWIELFCLFELCGGILSPNPDNPAEPKANMRKCLSVFKATCKLVCSTCLPRSEQLLFSVSTRPSCRLRCIGYSNFVSCIQAHIEISAEDRRSLLKGLLTCRMKLSSSKSRAIDNGTLHIPETRLKMRGCPPWRSLIFTGDRAYVSKGVASQDHLATSEELNCGGTDRVLYITCPKCTATKCILNNVLHNHKGFRTVFCPGCKRTTCSKGWKCICSEPKLWFQCPVHSKVGFSICKPVQINTTHALVPPSAITIARSGASACPSRLEAGVGVSLRGVKRSHIPSDHDTPVNVRRQRGKRGVKRKADTPLDAILAVQRLRDAIRNPVQADGNALPLHDPG